MRKILSAFLLLAAACLPLPAHAAGRIHVMILDGESGGPYHKWQAVTPILRKELDEVGMFDVDVFTAPPAGGDFTTFKPVWSNYQVIVFSYVDSVVTLQRGVEWAATGKVIQKVPAPFPMADTVSYRTDLAALDPNAAKGISPLDAPPMARPPAPPVAPLRPRNSSGPEQYCSAHLIYSSGEPQ